MFGEEMNLKDEVVVWPKRFKPIPKPWFVIRLDDHFQVVTLDDDFNLLDEVYGPDWNKFRCRRSAIKWAAEEHK